MISLIITFTFLSIFVCFTSSNTLDTERKYAALGQQAAAGNLPSTLSLSQPKAIAFIITIEPTHPSSSSANIPGSTILEYKLSSTTQPNAIGLVAISVDGRILVYQSTEQCLINKGKCWLSLSKFDRTTIEGNHVLRLQVLEAHPPYAPLSNIAERKYTIKHSKLKQNVANDFIKWWHTEAVVWKTVKFLGVSTQKLPSDLWNYQEIIESLKPTGVIETGTRSGGSALYFATILANVIPRTPLYVNDENICQQTSSLFNDDMCKPFILSVDIDHYDTHQKVKNHNRITLLTASSIGTVMRTKLDNLLRIPTLPRSPRSRLFVILDSDHSRQHVYEELKLFAEYLLAGDYLVVEDGIINGHPVDPNWENGGPYEAIEDFEAKYGKNTLFLHDLDREGKFGVTMAPNGFLIRTAQEWIPEMHTLGTITSNGKEGDL